MFVFGSPSPGDGSQHGGVFNVRCGGSGGGGDGVCDSAFSLPYAQLLPTGLLRASEFSQAYGAQQNSWLPFR